MGLADSQHLLQWKHEGAFEGLKGRVDDLPRQYDCQERGNHLAAQVIWQAELLLGFFHGFHFVVVGVELVVGWDVSALASDRHCR